MLQPAVLHDRPAAVDEQCYAAAAIDDARGAALITSDAASLAQQRSQDDVTKTIASEMTHTSKQ